MKIKGVIEGPRDVYFSEVPESHIFLYGNALWLKLPRNLHYNDYDVHAMNIENGNTMACDDHTKVLWDPNATIDTVLRERLED